MDFVPPPPPPLFNAVMDKTNEAKLINKKMLTYFKFLLYIISIKYYYIKLSRYHFYNFAEL